MHDLMGAVSIKGFSWHVALMGGESLVNKDREKGACTFVKEKKYEIAL